MPETLTEAPCGCIVRGNTHTWRYHLYAVLIQDKWGEGVRTVEIPANDPDDAIHRVRDKGFDYPKGWTYTPLRPLVKQGRCCTVSSPCLRCFESVVSGITMP
ncbi:hypothetical protein [Kitasatospora cineracea]|uniref:hypothetical protein n=1 Tax=Kitasatospora cineracea TaxID=88074 RepID=UPI00380D8AFD